MRIMYQFFLDRKTKLQPGQAGVAIVRMRNKNALSDSKQICLVPNPSSQSSVVLGSDSRSRGDVGTVRHLD